MAHPKHPPVKRPLPLRSAIRGYGIPALPSAKGATLLSLVHQFEQNERLPAGQLNRYLFRQISNLLRHAEAHTAYYPTRFKAAGFDPAAELTLERWNTVPILTRADIQNSKDELTAQKLPKSHTPTSWVTSSGSTGAPIAVLNSHLQKTLWDAATIYEHIVHGRDFGALAGAVRVFKKTKLGPKGARMKDWGKPFTTLLHTGEAGVFDIHEDPEQMADWIIREKFKYLLLFPSSLEAVLPILHAKNADLGALAHFRTVSEQLAPEIRTAAQDLLGKKIIDMYSAQEVGYIAIQCPLHDHYHMIPELCFTEILREDGTPCQPGEVGRVVVTVPYSYPFPLIRYDIGDYAELGAPCDCGRTQPVLKRIMGRVRNLVTLPDGSRHWPMTASKKLREIVPFSQFQMVQTSLTEVTARFVTERAITADEQATMTKIIQDRLGHPFKITIEEPKSLARGANGKFEEFKSDVTPAMAETARQQAH